MEGPRKTVVKAIIRNKVIIVNAVAEERDVQLYSELKYVGYGQYHSIDGSPMKDKKFYHFWQYQS